MSQSLTKPVTPPSGELLLKPPVPSIFQRVVFNAVLAGVVIFISIVASPFFLLLLLVVGAMHAQNQRRLKNASIKITKDAIVSCGGSGRVEQTISFRDVYKVVQADPLMMNYPYSSAFGIVFVNNKGQILFHIWTFDYPKVDIEKVFNLFHQDDTMQLGRSGLKQIQKILTEGQQSR